MFVVIPLIVTLLLLLMFVKVFGKMHADYTLGFVVFQSLAMVVFYGVLVVWLLFDIKLFGHFSFGLIVVFFGILTAFSYLMLDKKQISIGLKVLVFVLSFLPWLNIPILLTPYIGQIYFHEILVTHVGFKRVVIYENANFRCDQLGRIMTSGGQYNYNFVEKHMLYEKIEKTWGFPDEVEAKYKTLFQE